MNFSKFCRLVLLTIALAACGKEQTTNHHVEADVHKNMKNEFAKELPSNAKTINVGTYAFHPPLDFYDEYGNIIGFDVDVITAAAAEQGLNVRISHYPLDKVNEGLDNGSLDVTMSAWFKTPEREQKYAMTDVYGELPLLIMVPKDSTIQTLQDIDGKKVAAHEGSSMEADLLSDKLGKVTVVSKPSLYLAFTDVVNKKVDAAAGDGAPLLYHYKNHPESRIRNITYNVNQVVFLLQKNNEELAKTLSQGLNKIKENGTLEKINQKWFGVNDTATSAASQPIDKNTHDEHEGHDH
ncbi:substrate-binding periplasmic protein [Neisseriaceae bacterium B1]